MRAQLLHLTGPLRGRTVTYPGTDLLIGSGAGASVRYVGVPNVAERHAEIAFVEEGCAFYLRPIDGRVFVNRHEVTEVILEPDDLIEFGVDGPRARFRICVDPGYVCKPVRKMLDDAADVGRESGAAGFTSSITRDLLTHATWQLKIGFPIAVLALIGIAFAAGWFSGGQDEFSSEIEAMRREIGELRKQQTVSTVEVARLRTELTTRADELDQLEARGVAVARVHDTYANGVCLLHGGYAFRMPGSSDRFLETDTGERLVVEYTGTGFLVRADGTVLTNRHVVMPWDFDAEARSLADVGFVAVMQHFTATFPGGEPIAVDASTARTRADGLDVAAIRVPLTDEVPVLELSVADPASLRGTPVMVVGYPTGVNALLAKATRRVVDSVTSGAPSLAEIIDRLAQNGAISPIITSGVLGEARAEKLVYDADTTSGGSGGPVFDRDGRVIGVNFAIIRGFSGSNFGVPIRYALELLD